MKSAFAARHGYNISFLFIFMLCCTAEVVFRCKMAESSMEGIDLYADVDDFVRVSS